MRAIVCGGRDYKDAQRVMVELAALDIAEIAHGGASGVDLLAQVYAMKTGIPVTEYRAQWDTHGRAAGPIRNQRMLDEFKPDVVVAFPGGRGTADMVRRAKGAGVRVLEVIDPQYTPGATPEETDRE